LILQKDEGSKREAKSRDRSRERPTKKKDLVAPEEKKKVVVERPPSQLKRDFDIMDLEAQIAAATMAQPVQSNMPPSQNPSPWNSA
jgi:hypothetical protein